MIGHSDNKQAVSTVLWPDAEVEGITIDYDTFALSVKESTGRARTIRGLGYIGFRMVGAWDEMIIESGELRRDHPMIHECLKNMSDRLGASWPESGSPPRNSRNWSALIVRLGDGCEMQIVAADFDVVTSDV